MRALVLIKVHELNCNCQCRPNYVSNSEDSQLPAKNFTVATFVAMASKKQVEVKKVKRLFSEL